MEEHTANPKKPLRTMTNRAKDLFNTYIKNEGGKPIPISSTDEDKLSIQQDDITHTDEFETKDNLNELELQIQQLNSEIKELKDQILVLEKEKLELQDQSLRRAAELENFRRRCQKEKEEIIKFANEQILQSFIELLDDLRNAFDATNANSDYQSLAKGVELIYQKAKRLFEHAGVSEIENPVGKPFDFNFHEALMTIPSEFPEGYVVKELQKGYMLFDKVLRHTKVITSAGLPQDESSEKTDSLPNHN
ncbi:MAG: nucleotide exchange factor GrpE [Candidatus Kapaibacteriales bacterium]